MHPHLRIGTPQNGVERLLDEFGLALLDHQNGTLAGTEAQDFGIDQRVGDVEDVERNLAVAERVGQP